MPESFMTSLYTSNMRQKYYKVMWAIIWGYGATREDKSANNMACLSTLIIKVRKQRAFLVNKCVWLLLPWSDQGNPLRGSFFFIVAKPLQCTGSTQLWQFCTRLLTSEIKLLISVSGNQHTTVFIMRYIKLVAEVWMRKGSEERIKAILPSNSWCVHNLFTHTAILWCGAMHAAIKKVQVMLVLVL